MAAFITLIECNSSGNVNGIAIVDRLVDGSVLGKGVHKANDCAAAVPNIVIFSHCDSKIGDKGDDASVSNNESS